MKSLEALLKLRAFNGRTVSRPKYEAYSLEFIWLVKLTKTTKMPPQRPFPFCERAYQLYHWGHKPQKLPFDLWQLRQKGKLKSNCKRTSCFLNSYSTNKINEKVEYEKICLKQPYIVDNLSHSGAPQIKNFVEAQSPLVQGKRDRYRSFKSNIVKFMRSYWARRYGFSPQGCTLHDL